MSESARTSWGAVVSLVLGLSSLVPLLLLAWHGEAPYGLTGGLSVFLPVAALTALPALFLGLWSLRTINSSEGRLRGASVAIAGLVAGAVGLLPTLLGVGAIVLLKLRATSQEADCRNNLRVIGAALHQYALAHDSFPPAVAGPAKFPPEERVSWMATILPLMAEGTKQNEALAKLASKVDVGRPSDDEANEAARNTAVRFFQCPGHPNYARRPHPAPTHYVGVSGLGEDSARLNRKDKRAGTFGYERSAKYDEATGGISYTLSVLETARDNGAWLAGGRPTVRGLDPGEEQYLGPGRPFGGLHPGVTEALWLDGSVRPFRDDTEADVLRRVATLRRDEE